MRVLSIDPGRRHCAICLLDVGKDCRARDDEVLAWFLTDVNSSSVPHVIEAMRVVAQRLPAEVGVVLIEKQVGSNHVACRVENAIHAFFLMSGHDVVLVDPKRKYAYLQKSGLYSGGFPNGHAGAKLSPFHRKRITALAINEWVLASDSCKRRDMLSYYEAQKKKDDLADALLQAFEHCHWQALLEHDRDSAAPPDPIEFVPLKPKQLVKKHWSPGNILWLLKDHGESYETMMAEVKDQGRAMRREIVKWCGFQPNEPNYEHVFRVLRASLVANANATVPDDSPY